MPNTLFHCLTIDERSRDFVVGDFHGCAGVHDRLLDAAGELRTFFASSR